MPKCIGAVEVAARARWMPLKVLDVRPPGTVTSYDGKLVLSPPDQHVSWRGDGVPYDPAGLIDRIRGAAGQGAQATKALSFDA